MAKKPVEEAVMRAANQRPHLDQVVLTDDVLMTMLQLMPASARPHHDEAFLRSSVTGVTALLYIRATRQPGSITALRSTMVEGEQALTASSFCQLADDEYALNWARQHTALGMGPRTQEVLQNLAMQLRDYYPNPLPSANSQPRLKAKRSS